MENLNEKAMNEAIEESKENMRTNFVDGGPFGAVIVKNGEIIARGHNTVLKSKDPTAHAEVNTIRKACEILGTYDLSDCILFTSAEPCPMCLSAIIWANIKEVYFVNTKEDAADIGFRDDCIYEYLKNKNEGVLKITCMENEEAIKVFESFKNNEDKIIY